MHIASPAMRKALKISSGLHVICFVGLLWWGAGAPRSNTDTFVEVIMLEIPRGQGESLSLQAQGGGKTRTAHQRTPDNLTADWKAREVPPAETMTEPATAKTTPEETSPTEKKPTQVAEKKTAAATRTQASQPATAQESLKDAMQHLRGAPGAQKKSSGWKDGTGDKPAIQASSTAIMSRYKAQVRQKILGQWAAPGALKALPPKKRPTAVVHVKVTSTGAIRTSNWIQKSGNLKMDDSVMRAIRRSSPVAAPPADIKTEVLRDGLTLTFKP